MNLYLKARAIFASYFHFQSQSFHGMLVDKGNVSNTKLWTWSTHPQRLWWAYGELGHHRKKKLCFRWRHLGSPELANWEDKSHTHTHTPPSEKQFKVNADFMHKPWCHSSDRREMNTARAAEKLLERRAGGWLLDRQDPRKEAFQGEWNEEFKEKRMNCWCSEEYRIQYGLCYFFFLTLVTMHIRKEYLIILKTYSCTIKAELWIYFDK